MRNQGVFFNPNLNAMEFVVYILKSSRFNKIYIGFTSNLIQRFYAHNYRSNKGYTKHYRPWKVIHVEFFQDKKEAIQREKFLKSGVGRKWIHQTYR